VLFALLLYFRATTKDKTILECLSVTIIAFVTHHLRDANRRGIWFAPFGSTPPLPDFLYISLVLVTPYVIRLITPDAFKYSRVTTTVLDV
jgi:hypothetical protein